MENETFIKYVEIFVSLFHDKKLKIRWGRDALYFKPIINLEDAISEIDSSLSEEEFIEVGFQIISIAFELARGAGVEEFDNDKVNIVQEIFLNNEDDLDFFRIHSNGLINTFEDFDFDISTKRSKRNPNSILGNSVVVSLLYNEPPTDRSITTSKFTIELTTKELIDLIDNLTNALDTIKQIN